MMHCASSAILLAQAETAASDFLLGDVRTIVLVGIVLGGLAIAFVVGQILKRQSDTAINPALVATFNRRVRAWWMMCAILVAALLLGRTATVVLFFLVSFWGLREFITLTPTRLGDHRALFWVFFLITPAQYVLVAMGTDYYGIYTILIPVYAFLAIPARVALAGDYKRFLERTAKIQSGLLVCVYALSHAPALLYLKLHTTAEPDQAWTGNNAGLLFYFLLIVQMADLAQFAVGKLLGRHVITPTINASKTWEGFFGGVAIAALLGSTLWWVTPFNALQSAGMAIVLAVMGFAGSMTMSAIKRDRGVEDFGTLVQGHAGVLDRIDSICFAAPVFFHLVRFFFTKLT